MYAACLCSQPANLSLLIGHISTCWICFPVATSVLVVKRRKVARLHAKKGSSISRSANRLKRQRRNTKPKAYQAVSYVLGERDTQENSMMQAA